MSFNNSGEHRTKETPKPEVEAQAQPQVQPIHPQPQPNFASIDLWSDGLVDFDQASGECVQTLAETMAKILEADSSARKNQFETAVIEVNRGTNDRLVAPVVTLTFAFKDPASGAVSNVKGYYSFVLADGCNEASLQTQQVNDVTPYGVTTVNVDTHVDLVYDDVMNAEVQAAIEARFPGSQLHLSNASACVVPKGFPYGDPVAVQRLLRMGLKNAQSAAVNADARKAKFSVNNYRLNLDYKFFNPSQLDVTGTPVRSDVQVFLSYALNNQVNQPNVQTVNQGRTMADYARLSAFMDFHYVPSLANNAFGSSVLDPQKTVCMLPAVVVTDIAFAKSHTLEQTLFALSSMIWLLNPQIWSQSIDQYTGVTDLSKDEEARRDVRGLARLCLPALDSNGVPIPGAWPKDSDLPKIKNDGLKFKKLLEMTCRPYAVLEVDVPNCAPTTNVFSILKAVAEGNVEAYRDVYEAAMTLTNGHFGNYFPMGSPIVYQNPDSVPMGTYVTNSGAVSDIRDIDTLAILNHAQSGRGRQLWDEWQSTFAQSSSAVVNCAKREQLLQKVISNVHITGRASRIVIAPAFFTALAIALQASGFKLKAPSMFGGNGSQINTTFSNLADGSINVSELSGIIQTNQGPRIDNNTRWYNQPAWNANQYAAGQGWNANN